MSIKMVPVKYIGKKSMKKDTVAGTGAVWLGAGAVIEVDLRAANLLCQHRDVWIPDDGVEVETKRLAVQQEVEEEEPEKLQADLISTIDQQSIKAEESVTEEAPDQGAKDTPVPSSVVDAIMTLDKNNSDHFSSSGKPKVSAVRDIMNNAEIGSQDVIAAWSQIKGE